MAAQLVALHLAEVGIKYECWKPLHRVEADTPAQARSMFLLESPAVLRKQPTQPKITQPT
jgi:hypothetical protein